MMLNYKEYIECDTMVGIGMSFWLSDCCQYPAKNFEIKSGSHLGCATHEGICSKCGNEQEFSLRDLESMFGYEWETELEKRCTGERIG